MTTDGLTEAAKKEIADAIRIVREDKFETFVRGRMAKDEPPPSTEDDDKSTKDKKDGEVTPPPKTDDNGDPPPEGRKSAYWGEIFE